MQKTYKVTITLNGRDHEFNIQANSPEEAGGVVGRVYGVRPDKVELLDDHVYWEG